MACINYLGQLMLLLAYENGSPEPKPETLDPDLLSL